MMTFSKNHQFSSVVVTSDEPWCNVWHTQLHYAWQLSKRFKVLFLGPPAAWSISNLWSGWTRPQEVSPSLYNFTYFNFLPAFLGTFGMRINDWLNEFRLRRFCSKEAIELPSLIWHFDHFRSFYLFRSSNKIKHIFHVIDPIHETRYDRMFSSSADIVLVTSPKFLAHYNNSNKNVMLVPQGVDLDFYDSEPAVDGSNENYYHGSILLLGTLTNDVDFRFLLRIATAYPGKLLIIGPDKITSEECRIRWDQLLQSGLVNWLGPKSPSEFKPFLLACKFGIIAYVGDSLMSNNLRSPLKVISYLAAGKSVISNVDCEIQSLNNAGIYYCENESSYFSMVEKAMTHGLDFDISSVNNYLESISYDSLLKRIFERIEMPLPSRS